MTPKHYDLKISPVEYILANDIGFCEGNVIKYVTRYKAKGGDEDLLKAKHYINMLLEEHYKAVGEKKDADEAEKNKALKPYHAGRIEIWANRVSAKDIEGFLGDDDYYTEWLTLIVDLTTKKLISEDDTHKYKIIEEKKHLIDTSIFRLTTQEMLSHIVPKSLHFEPAECWQQYVTKDMTMSCDVAEKYVLPLAELKKRVDKRAREKNTIHIYERYGDWDNALQCYKQHATQYTDENGNFLPEDRGSQKSISYWSVCTQTGKLDGMFPKGQNVEICKGKWSEADVKEEKTRSEIWTKNWNTEYKEIM